MKILKTVYFLAASALILVTAYLFGYEQLEGSLKGNDTGAALTAANWFAQGWGFGPRWYPLQNAGLSLREGTYIGAYYLPALLSRLTPLTVVQALRLVAFLSVFFTSLGLYFYVFYKFKNQTMAMLAGFFYPLSQMIWGWVTVMGVYAQSVSFAYVMPSFLFFDLYLSQKRKGWFILTVFFFILTLFTHLFTGVVVFLGLFLYAFLLFLLGRERSWSNLRKTAFSYLKVIFLTIILSAYWLFPLLRYSLIAARNGFRSLSAEMIPYLDLPTVFGLRGPTTGENIVWYCFFAGSILILAVIGFLFALYKKEKTVIVLTVLFSLFIFYAALPGFWPGLFKLPLFKIWFFSEISYRAFFLSMIVLPVIASYACWGLASLILRNQERFVLKLASACLTLLIAVGALVVFRHSPPDQTASCYQGYGLGKDTSIDYCQFFQKLKNIQGISKEGTPFESTVLELIKELRITPSDRLDFSPSWATLSMIWNNYSDASIIPVYWFQMTLNNSFWGYQQGIFYNPPDPGTPTKVANLTRDFGINYVFLNQNFDTVERYPDSLWETVPLRGTYSVSPPLVKRFRESIPLVTWTKKPTILVIGRHDKQVYELTFRAAKASMIPYDQALLVESKESGNIDDYSLVELKKFDILLLYGYHYNNRQKAWKLIDQYVEEGGKVFIETGWQYVNQDWQWQETPQVLPLGKLEWKDFGTVWDLKLSEENLIGEIEVGKFSPPIWKGESWKVSSSKPENLRAWAKPIITLDGYPLLAGGDYGRGKIIWSGMNLLGHIFVYENEEELKLVAKIISIFEEAPLESDLPGVKIKRDNPNRVEFTFDQKTDVPTSLYWRENFFPDWKARLQMTEDGRQKTVSLPIYRAGPNMMLMRIPPVERETKIALELKEPLVNIISKFLTFFTLFLIFVWLFCEKWFQKILILIKSPFYQRTKKWWEKEDE